MRTDVGQLYMAKLTDTFYDYAEAPKSLYTFVPSIQYSLLFTLRSLEYIY